MKADDLTKVCLGWHCDWRQHCKHHALPAKNLTQYFVPSKTGEFCDHYVKQEKSWGEGKDEADE